MEKFAQLFDLLEQTKSTSEKTDLIKNYFETTPSKDAVWALFFLTGNRFKRLISANMLFNWCMEYLNLPAWLMAESYSAVGDTAETIALLLPKKETTTNRSLSYWIEERILPLQGENPEFMKQKIFDYWSELDSKGVFLLNKLLGGSLRIGVSQLLTIQGLSKALNIPKEVLSQKLMGNWTPTEDFYLSLKDTNTSATLNPYPFYLASPLDKPLEDLGEVADWCAEWKWDGIRAQAIQRGGKAAIWSRGNELVTHQFPEIEKALLQLNSGTVLDGEILAYKEGGPLPFGELQKRLGRKKVTTAMMNQVPLVFMIYDILEHRGEDIRQWPFDKRRSLLHTFEQPLIKVSPLLPFYHWSELEDKREDSTIYGTEGIILKKKSSVYGVGRRRGSWWKYKIDPRTIDAILLYAQTGQGWRANLYTDYTFGVWHGDELVPIAKAYSGLTQEEISQLDKWIRMNTVEKFGPVRRVKPDQVFEIAFEGIQESKRHKSGIALRFPRINRWRNDKPPSECDSLESIKKQFL